MKYGKDDIYNITSTTLGFYLLITPEQSREKLINKLQRPPRQNALLYVMPYKGLITLSYVVPNEGFDQNF